VPAPRRRQNPPAACRAASASPSGQRVVDAPEEPVHPAGRPRSSRPRAPAPPRPGDISPHLHLPSQAQDGCHEPGTGRRPLRVRRPRSAVVVPNFGRRSSPRDG
jgi:hypothetical protein